MHACNALEIAVKHGHINSDQFTVRGKLLPIFLSHPMRSETTERNCTWLDFVNIPPDRENMSQITLHSSPCFVEYHIT